MQSGKINDPGLRKKAVKLVVESVEPLSIQSVAEALGLGWPTARAILLDLSLRGEVAAYKTSKSWVFAPPNEPLVAIQGPRVSSR